MAPVHNSGGSLPRSTPAPDEQKWILGVRAGDTNALEEIFHAYYDILCDVAEMYLPEDAAGDVVRDVFLKIWQRRTMLDIHGSLLGYLCISVRNHSLNITARNRREKQLLSELDTADAVAPTMESAEPGEFSSILLSAIEALPKQRRLVIQLRWQRGLTFSQIAEALGVSIRTVETNHLRAMQDLRERLKGKM